MHLPENLVDEWIREDIPFMDLTTSILGIANKSAKASLHIQLGGSIGHLDPHNFYRKRDT